MKLGPSKSVLLTLSLFTPVFKEHWITYNEASKSIADSNFMFLKEQFLVLVMHFNAH